MSTLPPQPMKTHEWHERTPEGDVRYVRAGHHGGRWRLQARLKSEEHWTLLDPMPRHDLLQLREVLWRKYQRRRLGYGEIEQVDRLIAACGDGDGDAAPEQEGKGEREREPDGGGARARLRPGEVRGGGNSRE